MKHFWESTARCFATLGLVIAHLPQIIKNRPF